MSVAVDDFAFDPPPAWKIPISLGKDLILTFRNMVPGTGTDPTTNPPQYETYPTGVTVALVVTDRRGNVAATGVGVIDNDTATCKIKANEVDGFRTGYLWRCQLTLPDMSDTDADVPVNGVLVRADGNEDDDGT